VGRELLRGRVSGECMLRSGGLFPGIRLFFLLTSLFFRPVGHCGIFLLL